MNINENDEKIIRPEDIEAVRPNSKYPANINSYSPNTEPVALMVYAGPTSGGRNINGSSNAVAPNGFTPSGLTPNSFAPNGLTPNGFAPSGLTPDGFAPDPFTPNPSIPDSFIPNMMPVYASPVVPKSERKRKQKKDKATPVHAAPATPNVDPLKPVAGFCKVCGSPYNRGKFCTVCGSRFPESMQV